MADQDDTKRPAGRFQPGKSGNPAGRRPGNDTLADAIRKRISPAEIADIAIELARDAPEPKDRMKALQFIADRAHGKVPNVVDATVGVDHIGAAMLQALHMTPEQRRKATAGVAELPDDFDPNADPMLETGPASEEDDDYTGESA